MLRSIGYSNEYWGWGAEDDDLLLRCVHNKIQIKRKMCKFDSLSHEKINEYSNEVSYNRNRIHDIKLHHKYDVFDVDGLNSLEYKLDEVIKISSNCKLLAVKL